MSEESRDERALINVLRTLEPHLSHLIVIGGWVPHLHRRFGGFSAWRSRLSGTTEVDVLLSARVDRRAGAALADALTRAGFRSDQRGAVWENEPETGEKIEFFIPHIGTAGTIGTVTPLSPDLGAISLTDLELLRNHVRVLRVDATVEWEHAEPLEVRVPTLGAYLVAKASTYLKRSPLGPGEPSRRAKDLVYVRDVLAAGAEVVRAVEADVSDIRTSTDGSQLAYAATQLDVLHPLHPALVAAGEELAERDRLTPAAARAEVLGYVHDLAAIIR